MTAIPIDGAALSTQLREGFVERVAALQERGRCPGLTVVLVGNDPASRVYVGINCFPSKEGDGLCGDVDYDSCRSVASHITPVPGGVGPMTIAMLLANTIEAAKRKAG